jgi:hypothetical protein
LCHVTVRNVDSDSTPRDIIIVGLFGAVYGTVPFIRSLRTTGCRARVLIFIDDAALDKVDSQLASFFSDCGCTLLSIRHFPFHNDGRCLGRYLIFYEFFRTRYHLFDRVVCADQDFVNALVRSKATTKAGIPVLLYGKSDAFHVMWPLVHCENVTYVIGEYRQWDDGIYPFLIHQGDRSIPFLQTVIESCPQKFAAVDGYVRKSIS